MWEKRANCAKARFWKTFPAPTTNAVKIPLKKGDDYFRLLGDYFLLLDNYFKGQEILLLAQKWIRKTIRGGTYLREGILNPKGKGGSNNPNG